MTSRRRQRQRDRTPPQPAANLHEAPDAPPSPHPQWGQCDLSTDTAVHPLDLIAAADYLTERTQHTAPIQALCEVLAVDRATQRARRQHEAVQRTRDLMGSGPDSYQPGGA